jgi:hypothetical protein
MMCGKLSYESRGAAQKAMANIGRKRGFKKGKPTAYQCGHCGQWHWGHSRHEKPAGLVPRWQVRVWDEDLSEGF